jgi:hypothetical protein
MYWVRGHLTITGNLIVRGLTTGDPTSAYRIAMATPAAPTATPDDGSGSLAAGIYQISVVGVDPGGGVTCPYAGCGVATYVVATTAGGASHIDVAYIAPTGAVSMRVYVSAVNGATPIQYFTSTSATTYALTTLAGATVAALPTTATAYRTNFGGTLAWIGTSFVLPPSQIAGGTTGIYEGTNTLIRTFRPTGADGYNLFEGGAGNASMSPGGGASTLASYNHFSGFAAGYSNTTGYANHFDGYRAGYSNTTGYVNHFDGYEAGYWNSTGSANHFDGYQAGYRNTTGSYNHFDGFQAGYTETAANANVSGSNNIWIGREAGPGSPAQLDNTIFLGYRTHGTVSNQVVLGNENITSTILRGNVGIKTTIPGGGSTAGTGVLSLGNGTAPIGGVADQVSLYSADVAGSAELFAMDEAGNTPQLSPHPNKFLNTLPLAGREYPWSYSAENPYLRLRIDVDMMGALREIERLSGKKFIYLSQLSDEERADWDAGQEAQVRLREQQIASAQLNIAHLTRQMEQETDPAKVKELTAVRDKIVVPSPYLPKAPPQWMKDRGVASAIAQKK